MSKINNLIKKLCPNGVEKVSLGSLMNRIKEKNYDNSGIEIVYSVTKEKGIVKSDDLHDFNVYSSDLSNYSILRKNQYAYNPARLNIGSIARLKSDEMGLVSPMYIVFELDQNKIDFEYFEHLLFSERVFNNMCSFVEQGARFRFDYKNWNKIIIDLPPLQIQKEIVNILNKFIEMQKVLESELEARKSQYEFWHRKLFDFDENVKELSLEELCNIVDYRGKTPKKVESGIFLVTAKNIKMGYIDYEYSKEYIAESDFDDVMRRGKANIGDVLFTTEAPCGHVAQVDKDNIALAQRVIKYSSKDLSQLNNKYLKYALLSNLFQNKLLGTSTGATVKGIKGSKLHKMTIPVPTMEKQNQMLIF